MYVDCFNTSIRANFAKNVIKDGYFIVGMFSNVPRHSLLRSLNILNGSESFEQYSEFVKYHRGSIAGFNTKFG